MIKGILLLLLGTITASVAMAQPTDTGSPLDIPAIAPNAIQPGDEMFLEDLTFSLRVKPFMTDTLREHRLYPDLLPLDFGRYPASPGEMPCHIPEGQHHMPVLKPDTSKLSDMPVTK